MGDAFCISAFNRQACGSVRCGTSRCSNGVSIPVVHARGCWVLQCSASVFRIFHCGFPPSPLYSETLVSVLHCICCFHSLKGGSGWEDPTVVSAPIPTIRLPGRFNGSCSTERLPSAQRFYVFCGVILLALISQLFALKNVSLQEFIHRCCLCIYLTPSTFYLKLISKWRQR